MKKHVPQKNLKDFLLYIKKHPHYVSKSSLFSIIDRFKSSATIVYLCDILNVSRSGYYKWTHRADKNSDIDKIVSLIANIQKEHNYTLGYRRMNIELERLGTYISESKTYHLMKKYSLLSRALYCEKNKFICRAINSYKNQLKGDFSASLPNLKWCIDITTIKTGESSLYLCAVIDLFDRYIVNWNIYNSQPTRLIKSTIEKALQSQNISNDIPVLVHSDQGTQFASNQYRSFVKDNNIVPSMSAKGAPNENAVIESFFATLKAECVYRYDFATKKEAIDVIGNFIEYYNKYRIQLKTKMTPLEIRQSVAY